MHARSPFCTFLVEGWRTRIYRSEIFPGFPFVPTTWKAVAFNRDNVGNIRIPKEIWDLALREIRRKTRDSVGFVASPQPISAGSIAGSEQPFVVGLDLFSVLEHFSNTNTYLPEFFMAGASEKWAIRGDSDLTVLGGDEDLISCVLNYFGGENEAIREMLRDFSVDDERHDFGMSAYIRGLVRPAESGR
jgi:hypothetical protein